VESKLKIIGAVSFGSSQPRVQPIQMNTGIVYLEIYHNILL